MVIGRVKGRKLVQWALAYLAGAWLLLQVLDLLRETFGWGTSVQQAAVVILAVGFLAALVLAWYHGEKGAQRVTGPELTMIAGILVIAGTGVAFVSGSREPAPAEPAPVGTAAEQGSIAVLPFADMSPEQDQEYFADGLTEELLNVLAQLPELRVASRTSAFAYKASNAPVDSIARALRVAHVLEGSVRTWGDRVRITAQLIDAESGYHLWSDTYDRQFADIFAVQDEISRAIVSALQVELGGERASAPLARQETKDPEAHALVLRGIATAHQGTREAITEAEALFRQAIERDPSYARAHAQLARVLSSYAYRSYVPAAEGYSRARASAERALALDSTMAEAHAVLASIAQEQDWDWAAAEAHFRRSLELNPGDADTRGQYAWLLAYLGRTEEALQEARRAVELDPVSITAHNGLSFVYTSAGQHERAIEHGRIAVSLAPNAPNLIANLAVRFSYADRHEEALRWAERAHAADPQLPFAAITMTLVRARAGDRAGAEAALRRLQAEPDADAYSLAEIHALLGNREQVLAHLERVVAERDPFAPQIGTDPAFAAYRDEPRFQALLRQMGLR